MTDRPSQRRRRSPRSTLDEVASFGATILPGQLGSGDDLVGLPQVGRLFGWSGMEVRLSESDPTVDIMACVDPLDGPPLPPVVEVGGKWSAFADLYSRWRGMPPTAIPYIWIELDRGPDATGVPLVFVKLGRQRNEPQGTDVDTLLRAAGLPSWGPSLATLTEQLPTSGRLVHVADLRPRRRNCVRTILSLPNVESRLWLETRGADVTCLDAILDTAGSYSSHCNISVDWNGHRFLPGLGVEVLYPGSTRSDPRWTHVFDRLSTDCNVDRLRVESLRSWGAPGRQLQLKLSDGGQPLRAKAYLAFRPGRGSTTRTSGDSAS